MSACSGGIGSPKATVTRIGKMFRPLEEVAVALEGKNGTPKPIEPDRHHRPPRRARDQLVAALQPQQHAIARKFALGKNAHDLAGLDRLRRPADRFARALGRNRQRPERAEDRVQHAQIVDLRVHDEADLARAGELQHHGIHPREVIRQEEETALRQPLLAVDFDAVNQRRQPLGDGADEVFEKGTWRHGRKMDEGRAGGQPAICAADLRPHCIARGRSLSIAAP